MKVFIYLMLAAVVVDVFAAAIMSPVPAFSTTWCILVGIPVALCIVLGLILPNRGSYSSYSRDGQNLEAIRKFQELDFIRKGGEFSSRDHNH